ncbi:MAG: L,D-transpeptidase [Cyanobacteriota bacterium]
MWEALVLVRGVGRLAMRWVAGAVLSPVAVGLVGLRPAIANPASLVEWGSLRTEPVAVPVSPPPTGVPIAPAVNWPDVPGLGAAEPFVPEPEVRSPVSLVVNLSDRRVYVYQDERVKTSFRIAVGRAGWETPTGRYEVISMVEHPTWQHPFTGEIVPPGNGNPLGVRWIGFWTDGKNTIGFHGTPNEETVGRAASHGCIRMYNDDVITLFEMVQIGTPVIVVP